MSRMFKEYKKDSTKHKNDSSRKWSQHLNGAFSKEKKNTMIHPEKCTFSLIIKKIKIKTILRVNLNLIRMENIIKTTNN